MIRAALASALAVRGEAADSDRQHRLDGRRNREGHSRPMIRGAIGHTPAAMGIEIQFLGAVGTVTGSQFLVRAGDRIIVIGSPRDQLTAHQAAVFGKTVDYILKHAPCRVLTVALETA